MPIIHLPSIRPALDSIVQLEENQSNMGKSIYRKPLQSYRGKQSDTLFDQPQQVSLNKSQVSRESHKDKIKGSTAFPEIAFADNEKQAYNTTKKFSK